MFHVILQGNQKQSLEAISVYCIDAVVYVATQTK